MVQGTLFNVFCALRLSLLNGIVVEQPNLRPTVFASGYLDHVPGPLPLLGRHFATHSRGHFLTFENSLVALRMTRDCAT